MDEPPVTFGGKMEDRDKIGIPTCQQTDVQYIVVCGGPADNKSY